MTRINVCGLIDHVSATILKKYYGITIAYCDMNNTQYAEMVHAVMDAHNKLINKGYLTMPAIIQDQTGLTNYEELAICEDIVINYLIGNPYELTGEHLSKDNDPIVLMVKGHRRALETNLELYSETEEPVIGYSVANALARFRKTFPKHTISRYCIMTKPTRR